ncbi:hypothetical protein [Sphingomonas ginsenosidivorax]|nr:hypothetical protein [Sphingomonas ginsenosidivorax]
MQARKSSERIEAIKVECIFAMEIAAIVAGFAVCSLTVAILLHYLPIL